MAEIDMMTLKELGLTDAEINVYLFLVNSGRSNATKIAKETKLNRSNLYRILDRLMNQKLVSCFISNNVKFFSANHPSSIRELLNRKVDFLKSKSDEISKIISFLEVQKRKEINPEFDVKIYSGKDELKQVLLNLLPSLKKGDITYAFGCKGIFDLMFHDFWEKYKLLKARKKVIFRGVMHIKEGIPKESKYKFANVRYANLKNMTNVRIDVVKETVVIFLCDTNDPKAIVINNKHVAEAMKSYFGFLWENAEEPKIRPQKIG